MQHNTIDSELMALHDRFQAEIHKERERINAIGDPGAVKDHLIEQLEKEHKEMEKLESKFNSNVKKAATNDANKLYDIFDVLNKALEKDTLKNQKH